MQSTEIQTAAEERTTILLNAASVPQTIDKSEIVKFGSKVLLQPYFWLMPDVLNIDVASSSSTTPTVATPLLGMIFALPIIQTIRKRITQ